MEKYKGIIWIRYTSAGSKSEGNKAYFINNEFNHYELYRKGINGINDSFFYPYHLKTVEVTGEIQKNNWIMVEGIEFLSDELTNQELFEE